MCGRFYLTATPAELKKMFKVDYLPELVPRYNIAPAQLSPIVIAVEKGRSIHMVRWGLVPSWSRDLSLGVGMIRPSRHWMRSLLTEQLLPRSGHVRARQFFTMSASGAEAPSDFPMMTNP